MRFLHSYSSSSFKDIMQHNSNSATLASEVMVFSDSISPCRLPKETSVSSGLKIRTDSSFQPGSASSSHLEIPR